MGSFAVWLQEFLFGSVLNRFLLANLQSLFRALLIDPVTVTNGPVT